MTLSRRLPLLLVAISASCRAAPPTAQELGPDGINGCDPGIPPVLVDDMSRVPIWIYGETASSDSTSTYVASFYLPKSREMTMQTHKVAADGQYLPMNEPGLYRAEFVFDPNDDQMQVTLHSPSRSTTPMNVNHSPWGGNGYKAIPEIEHVADGMDRFKVFFEGVRSRFYLADDM